MMLMLKVCQREKNGESLPKETAMKIVKLEEEKVLLYDRSRMNNTRHIWYLDTGASSHMAGDKAQFSELNLPLEGQFISVMEGLLG
jgi:hypothetical protein